ncbi:alpha/beta hydrolase [Natrialbaceae archaeon GCM10025810]|uniref:alpha/beta hydrolase n=1 Tax=Halovalidus salilacus TaxID=3075124 RepID=UPI0036241D8E
MTDVIIPGGRDVRGALDEPAEDGADERESNASGDGEAIVVACPPHPQHGGSRTDPRLVAVSDALTGAGIACLRFDYGPWDGGYGEREDVRNALRWAAERYDAVGLFGYSFGASEAVLAGANLEDDRANLAGVVALAPTARLADDLDVLEALADLEAPIAVCYGERDATVEWEPVVDATAERGGETVALPADHFFVGQEAKVARTVRSLFEGWID